MISHVSDHVERSAVKRNTVIAVCLGVCAIPITVVLTGVSLGQIQRDLGGSLWSLQFMLNGFILTYAALTIPFGSIADRKGRRPVFILGTIGFVLAPIVCALAPSMQILVLGRLLQGIAAALIAATCLALLAEAFPEPRERRYAFGIMGVAISLALIVGAVGGGWLVDRLGWRTSFFALAVYNVVALLFAFGLRDSRDANAEPVDLPGSMTILCAFAAWIAFGIFLPVMAWNSQPMLVLLGAAIAFSVLFILVERASPAPMIKFRLFCNRGFTIATIINLIFTGVWCAMLYFVPLYLQTAGGLTAMDAGLTMLAMLVPALVTPWLVGWSGSSFAPGPLLAAGCAIMAGGFFVLTGGFSTDRDVVMLAGLMIIGVGSGFINGLADATALSALPPEVSATGTGIFDALRCVGNSGGAIIAGAVLTSGVGHVLPGLLGEAGSKIDNENLGAISGAIVSGDTGQAASIAGVPDTAPFLAAAHASYASAMENLMFYLCLACGLGLIVSIVLFRRQATRLVVEAAGSTTGVRQ